MRTASGLVTGAGAVAACLVVVGLAGLTLVAHRTRRFPRLLRAGLTLIGVGFLVLLVAVLIQATIFGGSFSGMPYLVAPGMLALVAGVVLIGIFILRSGVLPKWLGVLLLVSSVLLLAANEQTSAVLLAIPFNLTIATTGYLMWTRRREARVQGRHRAQAPQSV